MSALREVLPWLWIGSWRARGVADELDDFDLVVLLVGHKEQLPTEVSSLSSAFVFDVTDGDRIPEHICSAIMALVDSIDGDVGVCCAAGMSRSASICTLLAARGRPGELKPSVRESLELVSESLSYIDPLGEKRTRFAPSIPTLVSALAPVESVSRPELERLLELVGVDEDW